MTWKAQGLTRNQRALRDRIDDDRNGTLTTAAGLWLDQLVESMKANGTRVNSRFVGIQWQLALADGLEARQRAFDAQRLIDQLSATFLNREVE